MMSQNSRREPALLKATAFAEADRGTFEWDPTHNANLLTRSTATDLPLQIAASCDADEAAVVRLPPDLSPEAAASRMQVLVPDAGTVNRIFVPWSVGVLSHEDTWAFPEKHDRNLECGLEKIWV